MSERDPVNHDTARPNHPGQMRSPRRGMCAAVLSIEAVLMLLLAPVMISVAQVTVWKGVLVAALIAITLLLLAGLLRSEWAYGAGWLMQAVLIGLGVVVSTMFVVGLVFAGLWATAYLLGRKIERERHAAYVDYAADQAAHE